MKIVRTLSCTADELFSALDRRFLRECAEHGSELAEVEEGSGYEDKKLGVIVRVTAHDSCRRFSWRTLTTTDEMASFYEIREGADGCEVTLSREYLTGLPAQGRLAEALLLGQMSNELLSLNDEIASLRGEGPEPTKKQEVDPLSTRLLNWIVSRAKG